MVPNRAALWTEDLEPGLIDSPIGATAANMPQIWPFVVDTQCPLARGIGS